MLQNGLKTSKCSASSARKLLSPYCLVLSNIFKTSVTNFYGTGSTILFGEQAASFIEASPCTAQVSAVFPPIHNPPCSHFPSSSWSSCWNKIINIWRLYHYYCCYYCYPWLEFLNIYKKSHWFQCILLSRKCL